MADQNQDQNPTSDTPKVEAHTYKPSDLKIPTSILRLPEQRAAFISVDPVALAKSFGQTCAAEGLNNELAAFAAQSFETLMQTAHDRLHEEWEKAGYDEDEQSKLCHLFGKAIQNLDMRAIDEAARSSTAPFISRLMGLAIKALVRAAPSEDRPNEQKVVGAVQKQMELEQLEAEQKALDVRKRKLMDGNQ